MDEDENAPILSKAVQFPYTAIPVPWSAILSAYRPDADPAEPPISPATAEVR